VGVIIVFTQGFLVRRLLPMFGERAIAAAGLLSFALGMGGIAAASSIEQLAVAMTLLSLGNGCVNPSMLGSISLASSETEQGENLGIAQSLSSLGRILGPLLGGMLFDSVSIKAPFAWAMILGGLALTIILLNFKTLPDSRSSHV
jgi:MFS family permease